VAQQYVQFLPLDRWLPAWRWCRRFLRTPGLNSTRRWCSRF